PYTTLFRSYFTLAMFDYQLLCSSFKLLLRKKNRWENLMFQEVQTALALRSNMHSFYNGFLSFSKFLNSIRRIFPEEVFGNSSINSIFLGYLYGAVCFLV